MVTIKKEGKMALRWVCIIALILLIPTIAYAQETTEEKAINALLTAKEDVQDMMDHGLHIQLAHDIMFEAEKELYGENYTQLLIEAEHINETERQTQVKKVIRALQESIRKRNIDYNFIIEKSTQIRELKERAYDIRYQLTSLKLRMDSIKQVNLSAEYGMYREAESLFNDGMYDAAEEKIKEIFTVVNTREAEETGVRLLYRAGRDNIINYIEDNWKKLLFWGVITAIISLIALWRGIVYSLKRKINRLELERGIITDLIKESQKERFVEGNITTGEYKIRLDGYEERIIDIDKKIPTLKERLNANQVGILGIQKLHNLINRVSVPFAGVISRILQKKKKVFYTPKSNMKELLTPTQKQKKPSLIARANNALRKIRAKIADMKMRATISKLAKAKTAHHETQKLSVAKKHKTGLRTWLSKARIRLSIKPPWTNKKSKLKSMLNKIKSKVSDIKIRTRIRRLTRTQQLPTKKTFRTNLKSLLRKIKIRFTKLDTNIKLWLVKTKPEMPKFRLLKFRNKEQIYAVPSRKPWFKLPKVRIHLPRFRLPRIHLPKFKLPKFKKKKPVYVAPPRPMPKPVIVKVRKPWFKLPKLSLPKIRLPKFKLPSFKLPKVHLPKFRTNLKVLLGRMKQTMHKLRTSIKPMKIELPKLGLMKPKKNIKPKNNIRNALRNAIKIPSNAYNKANNLLKNSGKRITSSIISTGKATSRLAERAKDAAHMPKPRILIKLSKKATRTIDKIKNRLRKLTS